MSTTKKHSVLVVDDDKNTRDGLQRALKRTYDVHVSESADKALVVLGSTDIDILLSDVRMPGMDGLALVQRALGLDPSLICILLTAYGNEETAIRAMELGAYDFLVKPLNLVHLDLLLKRALHSRSMADENRQLREQLDDKFGLENIVGTSRAMRNLFDVIRQTAQTQATVLLQGESGTGKELVAHAIHNLSRRNRGPFVAVHGAALAPSLLESELFGHEKGAFTGATGRRRGRFELADGGTLFLDEISELDLQLQVKLLRVIEERTFERVGGGEPIEVDIRLVAATNTDLKQRVADGEFREDLFFRLDVVNIILPPLRERREDIPLLCDHFIRELNRKNEKQVERIKAEAVTILQGYNWPGNVRELRNTVEKMVVIARGRKLSARDVPASIREASQAGDVLVGVAGGTAGPGSLAESERRMIEAALRRHNGNRTKAAEELGVSRRTLHRKLKEYADPAGAESAG